ncbi:MAG: beta-galactosidase [Planctomycetaceae bacterium]|nr:beta-galactosidase [Planctomycetaceae bacterium]
MPTITYDDGSFLLDNQRLWLVSGSIDYFRTPAALWPDRLLKAKRAGLNCICTYVPWNFHEPFEGKWETSGDHDVYAFVRAAGELGLYVILRPGPYIGGQWDFGGLPAWLLAKPGLALRANNATFLHYFDKYFRKMLPRLAEQQVTRGGNIILVQSENEYTLRTMPDRLQYLEFVSQLLRRSGFEVPIITCNDLTEPAVPEAIETVRGWDHVVQNLKRLRSRQGGAPLLVGELWAGHYDQWSGQHTRRGAADVARKAMEVLGCGAQFNYYPWHGGTNFAFKAGAPGDGPDCFQTTSFDFDAPLSEGGGLTQKYYTTRLVNLLAHHMGAFLAASYAQEARVNIHDSSTVLNVSGSRGRWAVVTNNGRQDIRQAAVSLPDGTDINVSLEPLGAMAVPLGLQLTEQVKLDWSNVTPLGFFRHKVLVVHGPAGWPARISLNGAVIAAVIGSDDEPVMIEAHGLTIVLVNSSLAMRTWVLDETLVLGPDFVGIEPTDVVFNHAAPQYAMIAFDGKLTHKKIKPTAPAAVKPIKLGSWNRTGVSKEPLGDNALEWLKIDRPRDVDFLGVHDGYIWYRLETIEDKPLKRQLFLPECEDRATLYLNGKRLGVWGRGDGAVRTPINADFRKGANTLTMLVDNLGRASTGHKLGQRKGLANHVYDARPLQRGKFKLKSVESFPKRVVPRHLLFMIDDLQGVPVWEAQLVITLNKVAPIHMTFENLPHHMAILCNERTVAFLPCQGSGFGDATLGAELKKGKNVLKVLVWGDVDSKLLDNIKMYNLLEPVTAQGRLSCRAWQMPADASGVLGGDRPAWYKAEFKYAPASQALFLRISGPGKGQIFLNGHNVGRYWSVGPQELYYLPECWLREDNDVTLFVEDGHRPTGCSLEFSATGPYGPR